MKIILTLTLLVFSTAACNSGPDTTGSSTGTAHQATETAKPAAKTTGDLMNTAMEKAVDPNVQGCLSKVKAKAFTEALPLCLKAANLEPKNPEVQAALDAAKSNAAIDTAAAGDAKAKLDAAKGSMGGLKAASEGMGLP